MKALLSPRDTRRVILILVLLVAGNRLFNHESAWGGIALMLLGAVMAVRLVCRLLNNKNSDSE